MNKKRFQKTFIDESKELYYNGMHNYEGRINNQNNACNASTKASTPNHSESEEPFSSMTPLFIQNGAIQPIKKYSSDFSSTEELHYDVKQKRKNTFSTVEEKKKFVDDYTKKLKTEMCKNWQTSGECKFGDKCSFAHGVEQLQDKIHLHPNYKTKPCKKFFVEGICSYGYRCQYIHSVTELIQKGYHDFLIEVYPFRRFFQLQDRLVFIRQTMEPSISSSKLFQIFA